VLGKFADFFSALIYSACPLDDYGYQPFCVTIPSGLNQELVKTQSTPFWIWVALVTSVLLAVAFAAILLKVRAKSNLQETDLVRVKADIRQYRMKITELQRRLEMSDAATQKISKIEPQLEVIPSQSFRTSVFKTSKGGESLDTCADMAYINEKDKVFAIADGVSQAFNSTKWAELLVANASEPGGLISLLNHVQHLSKEWEADCSVLLKDEDPQSFIKQKQLQGSQSTLAILKLVSRDDSVKKWEFNTVGDSLLIALDSSKPTLLIKRFCPWSNTSDFPTGPDVIATNPPYLRGHVKTYQFEFAHEESYLLMTDALARYAVTNCKVGTSVLTVFPFLEDDQHNFETWIESARKSGLDDDDSTLISIFPIYE